MGATASLSCHYDPAVVHGAWVAALTLLLVMVVASRLVIGGSGSGKSEGVLLDLIAIVEQRDCALIVMDPHGSLARKLFLHLINRGQQKRVLWDQLSGYRRILGALSLQQSTDPDRLRRKGQNNARIMRFLNTLWRAAQRDENDIINSRMTYMYAELATRIMLFQREPVPLKLMPYLFRLKHRICHHLVAFCTDEEAREEWYELMDLAKRNSHNLLEQKIGGAKRLIRTVFNFPAFEERCAGSFDLLTALKNKQIIILDGSDDGSVPKEAMTAVFGCWNIQIIQTLQANFTATGTPVPVVVVWEEAPAANLISSNFETDMVMEGRKYGFSALILGQGLRGFDLKTKEAVKGCTPDHWWYNPMDTDLAKEAGEDIAYALLDPQRIKYVHETSKTEFLGYTTKIRKGVSHSEHGKTVSESEFEQAVYVPSKEFRKEFFSLDDQIKLVVQMLMRMTQGFRMVRTRTHVSSEPFNPGMLDDVWPEEFFPGLARKKIDRAIAESQARPEFHTPVDSEEIWLPSETTTDLPVSETKQPGDSSTFTPLPTSSSSKRPATRRSRRRGKG